MNKKTFILSAVFFIVALAWLGINIYWVATGRNVWVRLLVPVVAVGAGFAMVYNECKKKRRRHLCDVDKNKIP